MDTTDERSFSEYQVPPARVPVPHELAASGVPVPAPSAAEMPTDVAEGEELVVLCEEDGTPTGLARKAEVHTHDTPLHRAFSCYLIDPSGSVLVTRRALGKATWPGVWSNTVCGHPAPGESEPDAARRRLAEELGIDMDADAPVEWILPGFSYRATDASGTVENEFCPVLVIRADARPAVAPDAGEVAEWAWLPLDSLRTAVAAAPFAFSPWMVGQLEGWDGR